MSVPPESLQVGKCYLTDMGHVRRVVRLMPYGRVQFEHRVGHIASQYWKPGMQEVRSFALQIEREVPCDWTVETDE